MENNLLLPLMAGIDIPIPELSLTIHPPRIEEIAFMGEDKFFNTVQHFCLNKDSLVGDESVSLSLTNFQIFMKVLEQSQNKDRKSRIQTFLALIFPQCSSVILPSSILLSSEDGVNVHIDDQSFSTLQEYIKEMLCVSSVLQQDNVVYNTQSDMAKKIANKMYEGRRKRAELNEQKQKQGVSVLTRYLSILEVAKVVSPLDGPKLTLFQLFDLMERYTAFLEWDIDQRVRLAGGTPDKPVETWTRDLHSTNNDTQAFTSSMINSKTQK